MWSGRTLLARTRSPCPSNTIYGTETLMHAGEDGGLTVFINDTSRPVIVITKAKLTKPVLHPMKLLHARLGHIAPYYMKDVVRIGLHTAIAATEQQVSIYLPTGSFPMYTQAKLTRYMFHAHDQTWMDDHVAPLSVVTTDMTGPLAEA